MGICQYSDDSCSEAKIWFVKSFLFISQQKHIVGTKKNHLIEMVLLSTEKNICWLRIHNDYPFRNKRHLESCIYKSAHEYFVLVARDFPTFLKSGPGAVEFGKKAFG